ncbi:hypothetical protein EON65_02950 [archaeon]|nr:MAG: hypothetical protein EON65_02950 [archaeon]
MMQMCCNSLSVGFILSCSAAIKIQKRVRIWIAKKIYRRLKIKTKMAIRIQSRMRVCLAKAYVIRLKAKIAADLNATVTVIQKYARRMFSYRLIKKMRKDEESRKRFEGSVGGSEESAVLELVSSWLPTYGVDPEYRLKRNRRITQRLFKRMLQLKYVKFVTRFGLVYLDSYPPRRTEEEILLEISEGSVNKPESLTNRDDFMSAFIPPFDPVSVHRKEAIEAIAKHEHIGVLHIPTAVNLRKSVDYVITTIQCAQRQRVARAEYKKMLRAYRGIILFQRLFRKRYEVYFRSAVMITSIFRMNFSRKLTAHIRKERNAAVILQCAYRSYVARSMMFDFRSVAKLAVLKSAPDSEANHGPEKALEHRSDTFWIANSPDKAEIRVEFGHIENIVEVWIMTSTYSSSPNFITIAAVQNKKAGYTELIDRHELPLLKERRWHKFLIPITSTKYFMLVFQSNYGDDQHIAVRQIRFIKSKESK